MTEFGTDGTAGQSIKFDRSSYNTTIITTSGMDGTFDTNDDLLTTYQFDNFGRTRGTNTKTKGGGHYGGDVYTYTSGEINSSGSNIKSLNRVADHAYSSKYTKNLLKNHSGETDTVWKTTYYNSSSSQYTASYNTSRKYFGNRSLMIKTTDVPSDGGGAYYQSMSAEVLVPGKTYTFSGYIRTSSVVKDNNLDLGYGACLAVRFKSSSSTYTREYSDYITGTSSANYDNGWRRVSMTFTVPEDTVSTNVYLLLRNAVGTAYFDGLQIESGGNVSSYNMLENSSFDDATDEIPDGWTIANGNAEDGNSTSHWLNGGTALKINGEAAKQKYPHQTVAVSGTESDIYVASCWAWAEALPDASDEAGTKRSFDLSMRVYYSDGTNVMKSKKAEFNRDVAGWQRTSMAFDLSDGDSETEKTPVSIRFSIRYFRQANAAWFDNAQLLKDVSNSYTYDSEGNLITAKENGEKTSALSYDSQSNLTSIRDAEDNLYEYEYNDYHQVTEAKTPMGQKVLFTYENKGAVNTTVISSEDGARKIETGNIYNEESEGIAAQAYVTKTKDQNGYETAYDYDLQSGRLEAVTTPDGTETSYVYDEQNDLLKQTVSGTKSVSYVYDTASKTRLESIAHNGFSYQFGYDKYGNVTSTSAAGQTLSTNTYDDGNGELKETLYGNEDKKTYTYTNSGRISSESVNGMKTAGWTYNYDLQPILYKDYAGQREHTYTYDITGRVVEIRTSDMEVTNSAKSSQLYSTLYSYDTLDRVHRKRLIVEGGTHTVTYGYNENGQPSSLNLLGDQELTYGYDSLGRLVSRTLDTDAALKYNYGYLNSKRNGDDETLYQTTQLGKELIGNIGYTYEYDSMGNIVLIGEGIREAGTENTLVDVETKITYGYDDQGQLVRENNLYLNQTIVYNYDNGGNLTSKEVYPYTEAEELSTSVMTDEVTYSYDEEWRDQLKNYDGEIIDYDEIGNPVTYRGKSMGWTGRQLDTLVQNGKTISYRYDASGLRTRKTSGSEETEYYYSDGQLAYEKRGTKEFFYLYDSDGTLAAIEYDNGTEVVTYYPAVNSRGDVEALYNAAGVLQARYLYDSWGKVISVKDADGTEITDQNHIGHLNPIRYRGYYYDTETGFYYVSSRYYDPGVGRFISADEAIAGVGGNVLGYNMYAYCFNNPVNMSDPDGNWPKWVNKVVNTVKKVVNTVVKKVKSKIKKVCGFTTQVDKEKPKVSGYAVVGSYESGVGYNKSFTTGKKVNIYNTVPNISEDIFDAGIGIDVNIKGYGASLQTGVENSFSINLPNHSFEWGGKPLGRNYFKHSYIDDTGGYLYNKITVNTPELAAGALIYVYAPGWIAAVAATGAAGSLAFQ